MDQQQLCFFYLGFKLKHQLVCPKGEFVPKYLDMPILKMYFWFLKDVFWNLFWKFLGHLVISHLYYIWMCEFEKPLNPFCGVRRAACYRSRTCCILTEKFVILLLLLCMYTSIHTRFPQKIDFCLFIRFDWKQCTLIPLMELLQTFENPECPKLFKIVQTA